MLTFVTLFGFAGARVSLAALRSFRLGYQKWCIVRATVWIQRLVPFQRLGLHDVYLDSDIG